MESKSAMTLDRVLSRLGLASRGAASEAIRSGRGHTAWTWRDRLAQAVLLGLVSVFRLLPCPRERAPLPPAAWVENVPSLG